MRNKILLGIVIILSITLVVVGFTVKETFFEPIPIVKGEVPVTINLLNEKDNTITQINLEDYIVGVVSAEMPASFELEALKAQAVAARTYAMYKKETRNLDYDLIIGTKDQAYQPNEALLKKWGLNFFPNFLKIRDAVISTKGQILTYDNQTINAFYFSMSNGYTENSELVFKQALPYLSSVPSEFDNETLNNYEYTKTISKEDFCKSLEISCNEITIKDLERSSSNRVLNVTINDKAFVGTVVRSKLGLRSTDFTIDIKDDEVLITTKGYGHGVGMSQYGANGMASHGSDYKTILSHYYQNTIIKEI